MNNLTSNLNQPELRETNKNTKVLTSIPYTVNIQKKSSGTNAVSFISSYVALYLSYQVQWRY